MLTILDGGMGGEIQRLLPGAAHGLWSAKALIEKPDLVTALHREFIDAGGADYHHQHLFDGTELSRQGGLGGTLRGTHALRRASCSSSGGKQRACPGRRCAAAVGRELSGGLGAERRTGRADIRDDGAGDGGRRGLVPLRDDVQRPGSPQRGFRSGFMRQGQADLRFMDAGRTRGSWIAQRRNRSRRLRQVGSLGTSMRFCSTAPIRKLSKQGWPNCRRSPTSPSAATRTDSTAYRQAGR